VLGPERAALRRGAREHPTVICWPCGPGAGPGDRSRRDPAYQGHGGARSTIEALHAIGPSDGTRPDLVRPEPAEAVAPAADAMAPAARIASSRRPRVPREGGRYLDRGATRIASGDHARGDVDLVARVLPRSGTG
jgi:hypothetical protein